MTTRARLAVVGLVALLLLGAGAVVAGGDLNDKVRSGDDLSVGATETVDHDLYVFASQLVVDGTINGDLVVGAGVTTINGTVDGDVLAGTGRLFVYGEVTGDVRVGAGEVFVDGRVGEDLLVGSGTLTIGSRGEIGEDLIFASGSVAVAGDVEGSILGTASSYDRTGTVGGSEDVTIDTGGQPGQPSRPPPSEPVRIAGDMLRQFITVVFLGGLALLLVPGAVRGTESALRRRPLASIGLGIGVLVGYLIQFIAVILLMILAGIAFGSLTLDGLAGIAIWLGVIDLIVTTFAVVVACSYLVDAVVGLSLARLVAKDWARNRWMEFALLVAGVLVVVIVTNLPVIGFFAKLVVVIVGLGAMAVAFGEWWSRRRPPESPPAAWSAPPAPEAPAAPGAPAEPETRA
jgi:hypothetical protein